MHRIALLIIAASGCADTPVVTTPAEITITNTATSARQTYRTHSAYALATADGEMVVFSDAPAGTDCTTITDYTARWRVVGVENIATATWQLDLDDGGSMDRFATSSSFHISIIGTKMSGDFTTEPSLRDNKPVVVSGAFDAPFCYGTQYPVDGP